MFDFDIQNIINIQPKKREKINIFDNISGYVNKSSIVNNNTAVVKGENLRAPQNRDQSLLQSALENNAVEHGRNMRDAGIITLKPELICAIELLPTSRQDVQKFINYSFKFREYKNQQILNMLDIIKNSEIPDSRSIIDNQEKFRDDLEAIINVLRRFFVTLAGDTLRLNALRRDLASFIDINSLKEGSRWERLATQIVGNSNRVATFEEFSTSEVLNYLQALTSRSIFSTSLTWDSNEFVNTIAGSNSGFINAGIVENQFNLRDSLKVSSPFHFGISEGVPDHDIASTIDLIQSDRDNKNKTRALICLLVSELGVSKALAKNAYDNPGVQTVDDARAIIQNLKSTISTFNRPIAINNPLILSKLDIGDASVNVIPLEFLNKDEGEEILQEDLINEFGIHGTDEVLAAPIREHGARIREYIKTFFPIRTDKNSSIIFLANEKNEEQFVAFEDRIGYTFNAQGLPGGRDFVLNGSVIEIINRAKANPMNDAYGSSGVERRIINLIFSEGGGGNFNNDAGVISTMQFFSLFSSLTEGGDEDSKDIARYFAMLVYSKSFLSWSSGLKYFEGDLGGEFRSTTKFWPHWAQPEHLRNAGRDEFVRNNVEIAIYRIVCAINNKLNLNIPNSALADISEAYSREQPINQGVIPEIDNIHVSYKVYASEISNSSFRVMLNLFFGVFFDSEDHSFASKVITQFRALEGSVLDSMLYDFTDTGIEDDNHWRTLFNGIERSTLFHIFFEIIRRTANELNPYKIRMGQGNTIEIYLDNPYSDEGATKRFAKLLATPFVLHNSLYLKVVNTVRSQYENDIYGLARSNMHYVANRVLPGWLNNQRFPLFNERGIGRFNKFKSEFNKKGIQTNFDKENVRLLDQLQPIMVNAIKASRLNSIGALDIENHVSAIDRKLMLQTLRRADGRLVKKEEFERPRNDPFQLFDFVVRGSKLLAIGLPAGFKNEMNKLFYEQEGIDIASLKDDLSFSKVIVEVYAQYTGLDTQYFLLKKSKFDLDYFISREQDPRLRSIDNLNVFDQSALKRVGHVIDPNISVDEHARRRNEAMSYLFKRYLQLMYGTNFDEGQFFLDRNMLNIDPAGSDDEEFIKKFESLVDNLVNEKLKIQTLGQKTLTKNIESLIPHTGRTNLLRVYSNDIIESTQREAINVNLTDEERELKFELEDMALKVASMFRFAESVSGGKGFFERLIAPKLFEKILIIDIPVMTSDINEYYVKIRMDNSEA